MKEQSTNSEPDRIAALELFIKAGKLEAQRDYDAAIQCYRQSLALYQDEKVKQAYFNLLATIGPD